MIDDLKVIFKGSIADLLEKDAKFVLYLFRFVEEIELFLFLFRQEIVHKLLEVFGSR